MTDAVVARIERVTHRYGKTIALNDLTLDIPAQCMVGMIGPDGVGNPRCSRLSPAYGRSKALRSPFSTETWPMAPIAGRVTAVSPICRRCKLTKIRDAINGF